MRTPLSLACFAHSTENLIIGLSKVEIYFNLVSPVPVELLHELNEMKIVYSTDMMKIHLLVHEISRRPSASAE
jgi:hypothetical protein